MNSSLKLIGNGVVKGSKSIALFTCIGAIMWFMLYGSFLIFSNSSIIIEYLPSYFAEFTNEIKLSVMILTGFGLLIGIGYAVTALGKFLAENNPIKNMLEGISFTNHKKH